MFLTIGIVVALVGFLIIQVTPPTRVGEKFDIAALIMLVVGLITAFTSVAKFLSKFFW